MSEQTPSYKVEVEEIVKFWRENPHHILAHNAAATLERLTDLAHKEGLQTRIAETAIANAGVSITDIGPTEDYEGSFEFPDTKQGILDYPEANGQTRLDMKEIA